MRTKTLLLTAAALAAGLITSQAQTVYSQNVVGYANVATPLGGSYYEITVPFLIGVSNGENEVFGTNLPTGSTVSEWSVGLQAFVTQVYDTTYGPGQPVWYMVDDATPTNPVVVPVGQGILLFPNGSNVTNVFAGTVAVNVGSSNVLNLANGGSYYVVSATVPYAGVITNGTSAGGGVNLNSMPSGSTVGIWSVPAQAYVTAVYDTTYGPGSSLWYMVDDATPTNPPTINVGQPMLIFPNGAFTWTNGLSSN